MTSLFPGARTPAVAKQGVLAERARAFVRDSVERRTSFFLYLNSRAPHGPATPAPRHATLFEGVKIPRTASFNEEDVRDKPSYVRESRQLSRDGIRELDARYRDRLRTLQAVDEMVLTLVRTLRDTGTLDTTYIVFTSDNGYLLGEHRRAEKGMPYEEAIRVPLFVRGPGVPVGTVQGLTSNIDLAPTIAELTGVGIPGFVDGRSLVPLLHGQGGTSWRQAVLIAAFGPDDRFGILEVGDEPSPPPFRVLRLQDRVYIEYPDTAERELYDLRTDPLQLQNLAGDPAFAAEMDRLHAWLGELTSCAGIQCHAAEDGPPATFEASVAGDQGMAPASTDQDVDQDTNQSTDQDDNQDTSQDPDQDDGQDDGQDTSQSNGEKNKKGGKDRKE